MPPKVQFTKEQILEAAFNLVITKGIDALSARVLAKELGSSVAPIYVNFKNTQELFGAVMQRVGQTVWEYSTKPYTNHGFFNIGIGQLLIAKDFSTLYRDLIVKYPGAMGMDDKTFNDMLDIMEKDPMLTGLNRKQCASVLEKMALQTSGLAIALAAGIEGFNLEKAFKIMEETAGQLVYAELNSDFHCHKVEINWDLIK